MQKHRVVSLCLAVIMTTVTPLSAQLQGPGADEAQGHSIQVGPRPFFLVQDMEDSPLKSDLLVLW
jgi:hypothetical protein